MERFLSDVRYAARGLARSPGFFAIAVATVAIGIGATTAQPSDPLTLTSMAVLFLIVSTAAILIPVWRATRVDPMCALRE